jgi:hypothetical protein
MPSTAPQGALECQWGHVGARFEASYYWAVSFSSMASRLVFSLSVRRWPSSKTGCPAPWRRFTCPSPEGAPGGQNSLAGCRGPAPAGYALPLFHELLEFHSALAAGVEDFETRDGGVPSVRSLHEKAAIDEPSREV